MTDTSKPLERSGRRRRRRVVALNAAIVSANSHRPVELAVPATGRQRDDAAMDRRRRAPRRRSPMSPATYCSQPPTGENIRTRRGRALVNGRRWRIDRVAPDGVLQSRVAGQPRQGAHPALVPGQRRPRFQTSAAAARVGRHHPPLPRAPPSTTRSCSPSDSLHCGRPRSSTLTARNTEHTLGVSPWRDTEPWMQEPTPGSERPNLTPGCT